MEELFVQIWLVLGLITLIGVTLYAGYNRDDFYDPFEEVIVPTMLCIAFLPVGLVFIAVVGPFFGIYKFGEWLRNKKASKA
jgi:hypothetical protein